MPITVKRIVLWRSEVENTPGEACARARTARKAGRTQGGHGYRHPSQREGGNRSLSIAGKKTYGGRGQPVSAPRNSHLWWRGQQAGIWYAIAQRLGAGGVNLRSSWRR